MSESYDLIVQLKANVSDVIHRVDNFTKSIFGSKKEMNAFQMAASSAAGFLIRDMVNSLTAAFGEAVQFGAQIETLRNSFEALKGSISSEVLSIDTLRAATQGTVSDVELLTAANQALALGLPVEDLNDLFAAAQTVGHAMGRTTLEAVQDLTTGIGRQSKLILDNLGILVNTEQAYEDYAETLGKTKDELTDAEKKTAFMTAAIDALNQKAEVLEGTTSEAQLAHERFGATIDNLKTSVGNLLAPLGRITPILEGGMPVFSTFITAIIPGLIAKLGVLGLATEAWGAITVATHKLVSTAFWTNPLTIAIMAIVTAVTLLYAAWENNWFGIRDIIGGVSAFIMDKIGWIIDGIKTFAGGVQTVLGWVGEAWNRLTMGVAGALEAQMDNVERSYNQQVEAVRQACDEQLAAVEEHYASLEAEAEESYGKQIDEAVDFWLNQIDETVEGFDKVVDEYNSYYDRIISDTESAYDKLIQEANDYYDETLAEQQAFVDGVREERKKDLDDLELNFLQQKKALEKRLEDESESRSAIEEEIENLEKQYREDRARLNDDYRLQELLAEKEYGEKEEEIAQERADKLKEIETQKTKAILQVNLERNEKIAEIRANEEEIENQHAEQIKTLEAEKEAERQRIIAESQAEIKRLTEQFNADILSLEQQMADAVHNTWTSMMEDIKAQSEALYDDLVGGSVWPDMMNEMVKETERGLGAVTEAFKELTPTVSASVAVEAAPGGITPFAATPPLPKLYAAPNLRNVTITQYNTINNEMDMKRAAEDAYRILVQKLEAAQ